jgi:excisionase family DNA binding protein
MADGYLSKRAAAQWLDVSEKTVDRLRAAGELEALKLTDGPGGRVRIEAASLQAYAERRRQQRTAQSAEPAERFPVLAVNGRSVLMSRPAVTLGWASVSE